jgi:hypothetical protein
MQVPPTKVTEAPTKSINKNYIKVHYKPPQKQKDNKEFREFSRKNELSSNLLHSKQTPRTCTYKMTRLGLVLLWGFAQLALAEESSLKDTVESKLRQQVSPSPPPVLTLDGTDGMTVHSGEHVHFQPSAPGKTVNVNGLITLPGSVTTFGGPSETTTKTPNPNAFLGGDWDGGIPEVKAPPNVFDDPFFSGGKPNALGPGKITINGKEIIPTENADGTMTYGGLDGGIISVGNGKKYSTTTVNGVTTTSVTDRDGTVTTTTTAGSLTRHNLDPRFLILTFPKLHR